MSRDHGLVRVFTRGAPLLLSLMAMLLSAGMGAPGGMARSEEKEPLAVVELGVASEWGLNGSGYHLGPTAAVEFTALKNWLVIEPRGEKLPRHGQTEWDAGFVFKKPFDLTPSVEFEPGLGPVWMHTVGSGKTTVGAQIVT